MIKKPFIQNKAPYVPPFNRFDDRPISKQIYKGDNFALNAEMSSVILSANPTEILNFFTQNTFTSYIDTYGNSPIHLIILIDDNKLNEQQKNDLIKQLVVPPFNLTIDSTNNKGETPLHIAIKKQFNDVVKFLITNGANANKINFFHQNCLHLAMIPNIKPCEKPKTPETLFDIDQASEDKNILYNELLSVFYNNRNLFDEIIQLINYSIDCIFTDYYKNFKRSKISLFNENTISEKLTPLEIIMKDIQNKIYQNIANTKNTESIIKKNISYYIVNGLEKMTKIIEDFIPNAVNEINLDSRNSFSINEFDIDKLLDELNAFIPIGATNKYKIKQDDFLILRQKEVEGLIKKELEKIHRFNNAANINTLNLYIKLITAPNNVTIADITGYYDTITNANLISTGLTFPASINRINYINKILPSHINNLNLWISYENMKTNKFKGNNNFPIEAIINNKIIDGTITYKPLNFFLIIKDGNTINSKIANITNTPIPASSIVGANPIEPKELALPNSYNTSIKDFDFIDLLKKNMIKHVFKNIDDGKNIDIVTGIRQKPTIEKSVNATGKNFTPIWKECYNLIQSKFQTYEQINETNLYLQTSMIIMQIIDRMLISNIKNKIYLMCVKKLKDEILNDYNFSTFKTNIEQYFNKIISQSNVAIKLDKNINDLISLPTNNQIDNSYNINDIVDEINITNIFSYDKTHDEMSEVYQKDGGNYLVFYGSDYNSINILNTRQCMRNSTSIIVSLFKGNNSPDIFKIDVNGYTPIFYAIKNGNYLLVKELLTLFQNNKNSVIYQMNKYFESPIYFAFKQFKLYYETIKPDWGMINVTFMNNLLLSAQINQNIPSGYYDMYKTLNHYLNEFTEKVLNNDFSDFEGIITSHIDISTNPQELKPFFTQNINISTKIFKQRNNPNPTSNDQLYLNINLIKPWYDDHLPLFEKLLVEINALIEGKKSITNTMFNITDLKNKSNFANQIKALKTLANIFEEKYKPNRMYKYVSKSKPTLIDATKIAEVNKYYVLLISMGIISVRNIFTTYFSNLMKKLIYTSNILNFDFATQNTLIDLQIETIINDFINKNIFDFIRQFYQIKLDQYDRLINTTTVIDEYLLRLIELLMQNGLIEPNSETDKNVRQYIVPHLSELLTKTLLYNQVLIDILHKHVIKLYHSMKTFDEITKF